MRVTLVAYTQLNPIVENVPVDLGAGHGSAQENLVEFAGRVCYRSTGRMGHSPDFTAARIREGHEDIIEHVQATFFVEGISRACSHQLVRHRIASFSQESQRYTELGENAEFVIPDSIAGNPQARQVWDDMIARLEDAYREFRKLGMRKEDARFLLPNATTTSIVLSMNLRSLRHFFWLRCDKAAQWEIRHLAIEMLRLIYPVAPSVFQDIVEQYGLQGVLGMERQNPDA